MRWRTDRNTARADVGSLRFRGLGSVVRLLPGDEGQDPSAGLARRLEISESVAAVVAGRGRMISATPFEVAMGDDNFFALLNKWASLETRHYAADTEEQADALALELSEAEDEVLRSLPVTKDGALAHLRFCATHLECRGAEEMLAGALRNAIDVLSRM